MTDFEYNTTCEMYNCTYIHSVGIAIFNKFVRCYVHSLCTSISGSECIIVYMYLYVPYVYCISVQCAMCMLEYAISLYVIYLRSVHSENS